MPGFTVDGNRIETGSLVVLREDWECYGDSMQCPDKDAIRNRLLRIKELGPEASIVCNACHWWIDHGSFRLAKTYNVDLHVGCEVKFYEYSEEISPFEPLILGEIKDGIRGYEITSNDRRGKNTFYVRKQDIYVHKTKNGIILEY